MTEHNTIAVAMSGGVDSSTVAAMLAHEGGAVVGLTLQLWDQTRLAAAARWTTCMTRDAWPST